MGIVSNVDMWLCRPASFRQSAESKLSADRQVRNWYREQQPSVIKSQPNGLYVGIGLTVLGIIAGFFKRWVGITIAAIGLVVGSYSKICCLGFNLIDMLNSKSIFNPQKDIEVAPENLGLNGEKVEIEHDGETLRGYYIPASKPTKKTVIYLHGRSNNVGHGLGVVKEFKKQLGDEVNYLVVDPRGYGESTFNSEQLTEKDAVSDVVAMYDYLVREKGCGGSDISIFGHSLGGAMAAFAAKELDNENKLYRSAVIQGSFASLKEVADEYIYGVFPDYLAEILPKVVSYPWIAKILQKTVPYVLGFISKKLNKNDFNTLKIIGDIKGKVLICHSKTDQYIPFKQAERLKAAAPDAELVAQEEGAHGDFAKPEFMNEEYISALRKHFGIDEG